MSARPAATPEPQNKTTVFEGCQPLPTLRQAEEALITEALKRAGGNQGAAARLLGITRQALNRRLKTKSE